MSAWAMPAAARADAIHPPPRRAEPVGCLCGDAPCVGGFRRRRSAGGQTFFACALRAYEFSTLTAFSGDGRKFDSDAAARAVQQIAGLGLEPQGIKDQPLFRPTPEHALGGDLRHRIRIIGAAAAACPIPLKDLLQPVSGPLVARRRVHPVAGEHPVLGRKHLEPPLLAFRQIDQHPLHRQLRQPWPDPIPVNVLMQPQPLETLPLKSLTKNGGKGE